MRTPWEIVEYLEQIPRTSKLRTNLITEEAQAGNAEFFDGCDITYNRNFKLVIPSLDDPPRYGDGVTHQDFLDLIEAFPVTGRVHLDLRIKIEAFASRCTKNQWLFWYKRILLRDLKCKLNHRAINRITKKINRDFMVKRFACQEPSEILITERDLVGKHVLQVNPGGVRAIIKVYISGRSEIFGVSGIEYGHFIHIQEQLSRIVKYIDSPFVLDGELLMHNTSKFFKPVAKNYIDLSAVLYVYDFIPLDDFEYGECHIPVQDRIIALSEWYKKCSEYLPNIQMEESVVVDLDTPEGMETLRLYNANTVQDGFRGIYLKAYDSPYMCEVRYIKWKKMISYIEIPMKIVGIEEGTGDYIGMVGMVRCVGLHNGKTVFALTTKGMNMQERVDWYNNWSMILDKHVMIRGNAFIDRPNDEYELTNPRILNFID